MAKSVFGAPLLIVDMEGGHRSINDIKDLVDYTPEVLDWNKVRKIADDIINTSPSQLGYKTIIFDNMSEGKNLSLNKHKGNREYAEIQHYGYETVDIVKMVRDLRDYTRKNPVNIWCTAWEDYDTDVDAEGKTRVVRTRLGFNPALAGDLPGMLDIIGHCTKGLRADRRELSFEATSKTVAKFRKSETSRARLIPDRISWRLTDYPMADILSTLRGGKPWPTDKYAFKPPTQTSSIPVVSSSTPR